MGVMAYQAIALTGNRSLLANKAIISLGVAAAGALTLKIAKDKQKFVLVNLMANAILGAASIYKGHYAYGLSALASPALMIIL